MVNKIKNNIDTLENSTKNLNKEDNFYCLDDFQFSIWQSIFNLLSNKKYDIKNKFLSDFILKNKETIDYIKLDLLKDNNFDNRIKYTKVLFDMWILDFQRKILIENNLLKEKNEIDPLTKIGNRNAFYKYLFQECKLLNEGEKKSHLAIIYIDIDNLKPINDTYGHKEGDKLLIFATDIIKKSIKEEKDKIFRIGGDEFVVIISEISPEETFKIAERIQNNFDKNKFEIFDSNKNESNKINISLSIGISILNQRNIGGEAIKFKKDLETFHKIATDEEKNLFYKIIKETKEKISTTCDFKKMIKENIKIKWKNEFNKLKTKCFEEKFFIDILIKKIIWNIYTPLKYIEKADKLMYINKILKNYASNNKDLEFNISLKNFCTDINSYFKNFIHYIPIIAINNYNSYRNVTELLNNIKFLEQKIKNINFWKNEGYKYVYNLSEKININGQINYIDKRTNITKTLKIKDIKKLFLLPNYLDLLNNDIIILSTKLIYLKLDYLKMKYQYLLQIEEYKKLPNNEKKIKIIKELEHMINKNSYEIIYYENLLKNLLEKQDTNINKNLQLFAF